MKPVQLITGVVAALVALTLSAPASAAFTLYDKEGATFSTDGSFNTFYVYSDDDSGQEQSRVKMGFLPNWIGFNFSKQLDNMKVGGRSSFWVTINDSDDNPTDTAIDVRQFYGTVESDWGQVLIGKDFGLFNRSNIFLDEILQGYGKTAGLDASGVSFGNIGSGYTYPLPSAQITYRTPDLRGFKLAAGIFDPSREAVNGQEKTPRLEAEATYNMSFEGGSLTAWLGGVTQSSEAPAGDADSTGVSYGLNGKFAGFSLTGSGFTGEGLGFLGAPLSNALGGTNVDLSGFLLQGSYTIDKIRLVASYGKNELDTAPGKTEDETLIGAVFYNINDYLKLAAEYNIETITASTGSENEIKTIALGGIINF